MISIDRMCSGSRGTWLLWVLLCTGLAVAAACRPTQELALPASASEAPVARGDGLLAGFGRADITPPPGVPISGYGSEGRQSNGFRHRIYARAAAFEDDRGERIVLAVVDLPHLSLLLHRLVAKRLRAAGTGIGADRLMLSATHAHSGPGNMYEARQYNEQAGALPGYDSVMVAFLVERIFSAVRDALDEMRPARLTYSAIRVPHVTRNRSVSAARRNWPADVLSPHSSPSDRGVASDAPRATTVDDSLYMIRVDSCDSYWSNCRPKGAFSVFAIHGTGNPAANTLIDGDIHSIVERRLEKHIERRRPELRGFRSGAFHLVANGTEGDVRPDFDPLTRCERLQRFEVGLGPSGQRRPTVPESWDAPPGRVRECLELARREVSRIGMAIGDSAVALYDQMRPTGSSSRYVRIERAFSSVDLRDLWNSGDLCEPRVGTAALAGSTEDGKTRLEGWRPLWLFRPGFSEGEKAVNTRPSGCHQEKRVFLRGLQRRIVGPHGLPKVAQFAVVRLGRVTLAFLPGEPTTAAGRVIRGAVRDSLRAIAGDPVIIVSLSNGYLQYLTTQSEYSVQHYEGGSTLYGPNTTAVFARELARLAGQIHRQAVKVVVGSVVYDPGRRRSYFPRSDNGPAATEIRRRFTKVSCTGSLLEADWVDLYPGRLLPSEGQMIQIEQRSAGGRFEVVAWDDQADVEVRAIRSRGDEGYEWGMRWLAVPESADSIRVKLPGRELVSAETTDVPCY